MDDSDKRWPGSVYDHGEEPDPRFSLANERTFLAWVRTTLALLAAALILLSVQLGRGVWWPATVLQRSVSLRVVLLASGALSRPEASSGSRSAHWVRT